MVFIPTCNVPTGYLDVSDIRPETDSHMAPNDEPDPDALPTLVSSAGITCAICKVKFDDRDDRFDHWVDEHSELLPAGFPKHSGD